MTKHCQEDAELKLLRSALLSSIRTAPKALSQDVCDTDVPDLDALREAALRSLNNQSCQTCDISKFTNSLSTNDIDMKKVTSNWVPRYRLRPQQRSNLVIVQAISLDADHFKASSTGHNPGVHAQKSRQASLEEDTWSKDKQNQWSTTKDECGIQNTESDEEIITVDSVHSDSDDDFDDKLNFRVASEMPNKISLSMACLNKFDSMLHNGHHVTQQFLNAKVESYPKIIAVNDIVHTDNHDQMNYIERELMHLQPGFDIELLGFDDSCIDHVVINDNNNCNTQTNLESESTLESATISNERRDWRPRIVINERRHKCNRRRSRSPSRKLARKRRSKTPPRTSVHFRQGSSRRSSTHEPLPKLSQPSTHQLSSIAVKNNDTNKPSYKPKFFALQHTYNRRTRSDNLV